MCVATEHQIAVNKPVAAEDADRANADLHANHHRRRRPHHHRHAVARLTGNKSPPENGNMSDEMTD